MSVLEEQIEVGASADTTWEHLHRVVDYPRFVDGVVHAHARGAHRAHLDVAVDGGHREFDAYFSDLGRGRVMTWQTLDGPQLRGAVALRPIDGGRTRVQVRVEYEPEVVAEAFGGGRGFAQASAIERTVRSDLEQFKRFVEHEQR